VTVECQLMGLTESSPASTSGYTIFGRTRIYRSVRNSAAQLTRSPSAPARLISPECGATNCNMKSPLSQVTNDETARVAVLADGSCAFFRARRKQESAVHLPSPSDKGSVLPHFVDVTGVSLRAPSNTVAIEETCGLS
jgi:hypothetical protein